MNEIKEYEENIRNLEREIDDATQFVNNLEEIHQEIEKKKGDLDKKLNEGV